VPIFHIVAAPDWEQARRRGEYRPPSLAAEGFIHFSYAGQVAATRRRHYAGVADLVLLEIDERGLDAPLVVEDTAGTGQDFPHLYGPLPVSAVIAVHPLTD
jgi:uncharacterized protein (DUF952 family)